jgi:ATP-dependent helicase YprA (DUF1998 family)
MLLSVLVTKQQPNTDSNIPPRLLELFQAYVGQGNAPFQHQAESFRLVMVDKELFLVAGTGAGKTLAIAGPPATGNSSGC